MLAACPRTSRISSSETSASRRHGEMPARQSDSAFHMFPIPATSRWSCSASPSSRVPRSLRKRATIASRSRGSPRMSGPSRRSARVWSSSTGPLQSTASRSRPRSTSQGRPCRLPPRAPTRQLPDIRRWLRSTRPPSNRSRRFLPSASTATSRRPSRRSAIRSAAARGCGVSTSSTSPTSTWRRSAARRTESPSGTPRA